MTQRPSGVPADEAGSTVTDDAEPFSLMFTTMATIPTPLPEPWFRSMHRCSCAPRRISVLVTISPVSGLSGRGGLLFGLSGRESLVISMVGTTASVAEPESANAVASEPMSSSVALDASSPTVLPSPVDEGPESTIPWLMIIANGRRGSGSGRSASMKSVEPTATPAMMTNAAESRRTSL